jgi:16S rRNA (cytosine1402-N4)-methyltransferase
MYPKKFSERYKEHRGDRETIEKVRSKGMTPAGTHVPIMYKECLHYMGLHDQISGGDNILVVDCTLGYGGHSSEILSFLADKGICSELIAFDQDSVEILKTEERLRQHLLRKQECLDGPIIFEVVNDNFSKLGQYLRYQRKLGSVNCLLADLGLSSMQIDDDTRGFTYKRDGPLDMRMNPQHNETAYELLCRLKPKQLKRLLEENSDEKYSREIAFGIYKKHSDCRTPDDVIPSTTLELANRVRSIVEPLIMSRENLNDKSQIGKRKEAEIKKELDSTVARTLQALRIELNGEFRALDTLLTDLPLMLAPGGRAVFLTFHSGEDRRVKKAFKEGTKNGIYSSWSRDVVRPSKREMWDNPRSTCCKLRWAIRSERSIGD